MFKPVLLGSCALLLQGCFYQSVNATDLIKANYFCSDKLGVETIDILFLGSEKVYCLNGDSSLLDGMKMP